MNASPKTFKLTLIGEQNVGKTMIANCLANKPFSEDYIPTIGASMVKIQYNDKETKETTWFYLWDTAGQEKYRSLAPVYFRDSDAVIIVYDVSEELSFQQLHVWYEMYNESVSKLDGHKILIIGNKIDKRENDEKVKADYDEKSEISKFVETSAGKEWADAHDCDFLEVSAKTGENIELIIEKMVKYSKSNQVNREESILNTAHKESSCC